MRILMLGDARTQHLRRWADHFRTRGDTVWIGSAQDSPIVDIYMPLPVKWEFVGYPLLVPVLKRVIERFKPDLLVAHYIPNYGLMAALSGFRPHVIVGWGSDLLVMPNRGLFRKARTRMVATRGQAFLVDAQMLVGPLVKAGAPVERVYVCPFGVDDDAIVKGGQIERPVNETPIMVCNRRHEPQYRIEVLLDALYLLKNQRQDVRAFIANAGSQTDALKRRVNTMGLADQVSWLGDLCRNRYLDSLARADIYVSPSPSDSTSVSLLEAMAMGLCPVVPDIEGNREWVEPEKSGLLYRTGDAKALAAQLSSLLENSSRCVAIGKRARDVVEERGRWSHTIRRAELLFDQLVKP
jgi:glycosyltransferase involved in cell wall biosynthesis